MCPSLAQSSKSTVHVQEIIKPAELGYAPSRCSPEGQDLLKSLQTGVHHEAAHSEEGEISSPSALEVVMTKAKLRIGRQTRGRKGEGASLAHPFNSQSLMTEFQLLEARQP